MYLWLKSFHIIFVIAWYAGMFYIWRLFVYHAMTGSPEVKATLEVMEKKLLRIIMGPAAVLTYFFGSWMLYIQWETFSVSIWLWVKLSSVLILTVFHLLAERYRQRFLNGEQFNHKLFRYMNEGPTLLLFVIVIMVIVKPFVS